MRVFFFLWGISFSLFSQALIFDQDDRENAHERPQTRDLQSSVAMMVSDTFIRRNSQGAYDLDFVLGSDKTNHNLCTDQKFAGEYTGWVNCSAVLVAEDVLLTAGHCMTMRREILQNADVPLCSTFQWIFDYKIEPGETQVQIQNISSDRIYSCTEVIYAENVAYDYDSNHHWQVPAGGAHGNDFALIRLDRKVKGRTPIKISSQRPQRGDTIFTLGHPMALPLKYAPGRVLQNHFKNYYVTDIDLLGGNSGGPAFNVNNELVGLTVRSFPYEDFSYREKEKCYELTSCSLTNGSCKKEHPNEVLGTHIQRIDHLLNLFPRSAHFF